MSEWQRVCALDALVPDRGAAALVGDHQVALFRLSDTGDVHAVDHLDPFSQANVMARGLVGSRGGVATVASPMHKQSFDLNTGQCLDDPEVSLHVWSTRVSDGWVEVELLESAVGVPPRQSSGKGTQSGEGVGGGPP